MKRYKSNGILQMLKRNFKVKNAPEKWQNEKNKRYDVVVTYEERVFNSLLNGNFQSQFELSTCSKCCFEDMKARNKDLQRLHVLNMTVTDNHEEAETGASDTVTLVDMVYKISFRFLELSKLTTNLAGRV